MAQVDVAPSFGAELKDGFKPANAWVANGNAWLDDMQQFYRERSAIEKEYSQKLNALAKKFYEKKMKKQNALSVGDTPTVTPGSLECASMTTWSVQLTTLESRAAEHERLAANLMAKLVQPLQQIQARHEDLRKSHADYAVKLEKERDSHYSELKKTKAKYDSACQEVENRRKKMDNSLDHGKQKAQAAYQQQLGEMRNSKNTYLIAINVTNKQKEKYYHDYVPDLLDSLQSLSEARTAALNNIWSTAAVMEHETLQRSCKLLEHLAGEIPRNNPSLDSMMFIRHNVAPWHDPPDFVFEPSPVWLDDDAMADDASSRTFLMNILTRSKAQLGELTKECESRRREVEGAKRVRQAIRENKDKRDEVEVVRSQFVHQEALHDAERRKVAAEVEISTIMSSVGDVSVGARNHAFKNETFRLPTNCDLCGDRIWGLSAKGLICNDCGFTCHTKCELKVPADCPGELNKEQKKSKKAQRQAAAQAQVAPPSTSNGGGKTTSLQRSDTIGSMNTLSSGYAASHKGPQANGETSPVAAPRASTSSARHRVMAPPPLTYTKPDGGEGVRRGHMLYAYQANGDGEITVADGTDFVLVEPDDGSGWVKIKPSVFGSGVGLVPASYVELSNRTPQTLARPVSVAASVSTSSLAGSDTGSVRKKVGPAVAPRRGGKKVKHLEALYTYTPTGEGEVAMEEGERMVLVQADQGDGWCEVETRAGKGIVPASWVKEIQ
ncbi:FCH-domain-containing protein [Piedraia hortae CBS 480.64]|uniref:Protein BZZ1 n=1 Tax=Piedraia hortae CBS 480.64 TaxID=1314780 RepID=A0A6A7BV80_9PEZI|nr:FCH-domain-containing protein [Piedraia hortae CBS 480.64]